MQSRYQLVNKSGGVRSLYARWCATIAVVHIIVEQQYNVLNPNYTHVYDDVRPRRRRVCVRASNARGARATCAWVLFVVAECVRLYGAFYRELPSKVRCGTTHNTSTGCRIVVVVTNKPSPRHSAQNAQRKTNQPAPPAQRHRFACSRV